MKKLYLFTFLMSIAFLGFSQKATLTLTSSFNDVEVFGPFEVKLIRSDTETARVEIDFNGVNKEDLVYEAEKGVLRLRLKNRHYMEDWDDDSKWEDYVKVVVYYTDIDRLSAAAGAMVSTTGTLKSKFLVVECSMGAEITMKILSQKVEAKSTMGGELELFGTTEHLEVKANMGGTLDADQLVSKTAYVKANMGAEVDVYVTDELEATAGFGATIDYYGGPSVRNSSKNFGGEVNRKGN